MNDTLGVGTQGTHTKYLPAGKGDTNQKNTLPFILANAKTVDEAIELVKNIKVDTPKRPVAHDLEVGLHYFIINRTKSIVIEYRDGTGFPVICDNTLGAMINEPPLPVSNGPG